MTLSPSEIRAQFRQRLKEPKAIMMPGAFNAIGAKLIERLGFEAVYVTGAGLHNATAGIPDTGGLSLEEMVQLVAYSVKAVNIPVICDADTGFGQIGRCVALFEASGVTGIHLEDQVFPKRCGHLEGKACIDLEEMQLRIREALSSREDPNFLIIARVDSRSISGFEDALMRAKAYEAAGCDAIFAEALSNQGEYERMVKSLNVPVLANMTEFGKTPYYSFQQFEQMGCKMVIYPMTLFRLAMHAMEQGLIELKETGTQEGLLDAMQTRQALYDLLDYDPLSMPAIKTPLPCS